MKAQLVPVYFAAGRDEAFETQLATLRRLLADDAQILEPVALGLRLPPADAVLFPQLLGDAYREIGVLRIVDENATAIDARLPPGPVTLAKLHPGFDRLMAVEGRLEGYAGYQDSDCRNGAVVRVQDGRRFVVGLYSHHQCLFAGARRAEIEMVAGVLGLGVE